MTFSSSSIKLIAVPNFSSLREADRHGMVPTGCKSRSGENAVKTMEVMDTTLRDGEQTPGVNYTPDEKLIIAEALLRSGVDAIEIASAKISDGEAQAVQRITEWGRSHGMVDRIEILGFVDGTTSVDWIVQNGGRVMNLLAKGSEH